MDEINKSKKKEYLLSMSVIRNAVWAEQNDIKKIERELGDKQVSDTMPDSWITK